MKGVVFQTSTKMAPRRSSVVSESIGSLIRPMPLATSLMTPIWSWNIRRHITAEMTVGKAQGTRTAARTRPRPRKARLMASAMPSPMMNSMVTLTTVKIKVFFRPSQKSSFWNISM